MTASTTLFVINADTNLYGDTNTNLYDSESITLIHEGIGAPGVPGPPGPPGPSGQSYEHLQSTASDTWIINHNLGFKPSIAACSDGGKLMLAEILHYSPNTAYIYFDNPVSGFATCS